MPVSAQRLTRDFGVIAGCTHSPDAGASRPTFSAAWRQACDYCRTEAEQAGCRSWIDALGNIHIRPEALSPETVVWLAGSHLDSVPHGGDYDGVTGVVTALECLRAAADEGRTIPLEVVIFAEEEGTTFGLGMLGSRGWAGTLDAAALASLHNAAGGNYWEAGRMHGADAGRLDSERLDPRRYAGFIEVHVEQGPGLWATGRPLALVTAIAGRRQFRVSLTGQANHAGSTGMADRRDALAGGAEAISGIEAVPARVGPQVVATVGHLVVLPNAVNVIPGAIAMTIDVRAPTDRELVEAEEKIRAVVLAAAHRRGLEVEIELTESQPATPLDAGLAARVRRAAEQEGITDLPETVSGALHDAAILAPLVPTVMVFVASRDGISHNPREESRLADIAVAARLLYETVRKPA
jgi:allantoate deiminase